VQQSNPPARGIRKTRVRIEIPEHVDAIVVREVDAQLRNRRQHFELDAAPSGTRARDWHAQVTGRKPPGHRRLIAEGVLDRHVEAADGVATERGEIDAYFVRTEVEEPRGGRSAALAGIRSKSAGDGRGFGTSGLGNEQDREGSKHDGRTT